MANSGSGKLLSAPTGKPRKGYRTCTKCKKNRAVKFFKARGRICSPCQRGRVSLAARDVRLLENYGLTLDDYAALFAAQGGRCAICRGTRRKNLDVDHSHSLLADLLAAGVEAVDAKRRSIRGLLCARCNRQILRHARDDAALLRAAADYLDAPPAPVVLG